MRILKKICSFCNVFLDMIETGAHKHHHHHHHHRENLNNHPASLLEQVHHKKKIQKLHVKNMENVKNVLIKTIKNSMLYFSISNAESAENFTWDRIDQQKSRSILRLSDLLTCFSSCFDVFFSVLEAYL